MIRVIMMIVMLAITAISGYEFVDLLFSHALTRPKAIVLTLVMLISIITVLLWAREKDELP